MLNEKTIKIRNYCESLIFWLRNMNYARYENDYIEIKRSNNNIVFYFEQLDKLQVTFRTQNDIIKEVEKNNDKYIKDIIKNLTIYLKDSKNTIISGMELYK